MKKFILLSIFVFIVIVAKGQLAYNYQEYGIGVGASYIRGYTNVNNQYNHPEFHMNFIYNYNPYLPITAEIQSGQLSGGGLTPALDKYGRQYDNHYKAAIVRGDLQLGAGMDYHDNPFLNFVKNFYVGTGIGLMSNSIQNQRYSIYDASYRFPGSNSNIGVIIPLRIGYEVKLYNAYEEPAYAIDLGYAHNVVFGSGIDGYSDPSAKFKNNAPDQYRQIFVEFKYFFGNIVSYNKTVRLSKY
ncbi:MAG: hypothetical protein JWO06_139 [Bacteroidota bacterium]|jgi:hypothetical protein|nr:hypothetical protein [Bacteroidota bacterium]